MLIPFLFISVTQGFDDRVNDLGRIVATLCEMCDTRVAQAHAD